MNMCGLTLLKSAEISGLQEWLIKKLHDVIQSSDVP